MGKRRTVGKDVSVPIRMGVVLAGERLLRVHVHDCNAEVAGFRAGQGELAAAVFAAFEL